jgi:glycosyltransferase involved in cell wall biosynthesis
VKPVSNPRRVTVVAHELRGIRPVGGMGTATTFLALALARIGHSVELLLGRDSPQALDPYWESVYDRAGIQMRRAPRAECEPWYFVHAHSVELGLREAPPDVVIAHDFGAPAYTALRLRQAGIAFEDTLFVAFCHGTRRYMMDVSPNLAPKDLRNLLGVAVHEQAAVELADVVVSPSAYLVEWMREQGWQLPQRALVIPYLTRPAATGETAWKRAWNDGERLERLSFFGRVDAKKGVVPFAAALNALDPELLGGVELEFVGKTTPTWTPERVQGLLSAATKRALRQVSFETELDQPDALARLSRAGTLAVMPSLQDNSPNAVYECLEHEIPFIASDVGGVPELIAAEDRARVLVEPTTAGIEGALRRVLSGGTVPSPARAAVSGGESLRRWAEVIELRPEPRAADREREPVGVGVLKRREAKAAGETSAPFVLLLDEDDAPEPELLDVLVRAQARTGADVVSCGLRIRGDAGTETLHLFSGDAGGLGALSNVYGTTALIRRTLLEGLERPLATDGDAAWPLLARLVADGAHIVSIPAPLVTRRTRPGSIEQNPSDALAVAQQLERALAEPLRTTARLVAGLASPP